MDEGVNRNALLRLRKIEGQVKGIQRMLAADRHALDIIMQLDAAESALHKLSEIIMRNHVEECVLEAFGSDNSSERQRKIDELISLYSRYRPK
jgi:DNA-binding FrmR family transcriptional regulator